MRFKRLCDIRLLFLQEQIDGADWETFATVAGESDVGRRDPALDQLAKEHLARKSDFTVTSDGRMRLDQLEDELPEFVKRYRNLKEPLRRYDKLYERFSEVRRATTSSDWPAKATRLRADQETIEADALELAIQTFSVAVSDVADLDALAHQPMPDLSNEEKKQSILPSNEKTSFKGRQDKVRNLLDAIKRSYVKREFEGLVQLANNLTLPSRPTSGGPAIDVGVIIALKEEFGHFHEALPWVTGHIDRATGHYDYLFSYPQTGANGYRCASTFVGGMGPERAALATDRFIVRRQPTTVVMLGIAAGIDKDVRLGDVVVGTFVDNYLSGARVVSGTTAVEFQPAGDPYRCSDDLVSAIRNIEFAHRETFEHFINEATEDLNRRVRGEHQQQLMHDDLLSPSPRLVDGPIACGPVVAAAKEWVDWVRSKDRKLKALEMEGGGVLMSACSRADPTRTLLLRGISDFGDGRKEILDRMGNGSIRAYAMNNAVRLFFALLEADILPRVG
jgi:nucleoside phosphorylase